MNYVSGLVIGKSVRESKPDINLNPLYDFSASSANDELYKQLWIDGAGLIFQQLNALLAETGYTPTIIPISKFENPDMEELKRIFNSNFSDKATTHDYYIFYSHVLRSIGRSSDINLLEIGLGTNNPNLISTMSTYGRPGASLYSWKQFLPNAKICGADVDRDILFTDERIKTAFVDQMKMSTFQEMNGAFDNPTYDIIIDDGLHSIAANFNTLLFGLNHIKLKGWIIIEDIRDIKLWNAIDFILKQTKRYDTYMIKSKNAFIFAVNRLR